MPSVLTIILNWRSAEMTLRSLAAARVAMAGLDGAITVVDNDSGDGSYEKIRDAVAALPSGGVPVRVIQSGHNGGFGAGNNVGIRAGLPGGARPDFVYLLNSDAFPAPDAIRVLHDHLVTHPATGFAGSYIHGTDGAPHRTAFRFPTVRGEFEQAIRLGPVSRLLRNHIIAQPIPERTTRVDWLAGASLMMRSDVLDRVGLFDEGFFLYFEETEQCHRAAQAGWPTDYVVESRVAHVGSASTGMKSWRRIPGYWLDSRWRYFSTVHGTAGAVAATLSALVGGALWRLRCALTRRDVIDPPFFMRDMARHHLRALVSPASAAPQPHVSPAE